MNESRSKTWRWSMMEKPRNRENGGSLSTYKSHSILYRLSLLVGSDSPLKWQTPIGRKAQVSYHCQLQLMKCHDLYKSMYIFMSYRLLAVTHLKRQHFKDCPVSFLFYPNPDFCVSEKFTISPLWLLYTLVDLRPHVF